MLDQQDGCLHTHTHTHTQTQKLKKEKKNTTSPVYPPLAGRLFPITWEALGHEDS